MSARCHPGRATRAALVRRGPLRRGAPRVVLWVLALLAGALPALAQAGPELPASAGGSPAPVRIGYDRVFMKGREAPLEGTVLERTPQGWLFRMRGASSPIVLSFEQVERVELAPTPVEVYRERAGALAPGDAAGRIELGRFCVRHGLLAEAEQQLLEAARLVPAQPEPYLILAEALQARLSQAEGEAAAGLRERLLRIYELAESAGVREPALVLGQARVLRSAGAERRALELLERLAAELSPAPGPAPVSGTAGPGAAPGEQAAPAAPALPTPTAELLAQCRLEQGELLLGLGRLEEAAGAFAAAAAAASAPQLAGAARFGLGLAELGRAELDRARQAFAAAGALRPDDPRPLVHEALAVLLAGQPAAAAGLCREAERRGGGGGAERRRLQALAEALTGGAERALALLDEIAPAEQDAAWELVRAFVEARAGAAPQALARLERLGGAPPPHGPLALLLRAEILEDLGELPAAEQALREAGRAGYDFATIAARLLRVQRALGRHADAARFAQYAAALRADDPDLWCEAGAAYLAAGREAEAAQAYERALALAPEHPYALLGQAYVLYRRQAFAEAEAVLQRLQAVEPAQSWAREALRRLRNARERRLWRDTFARPDGPEVRNRWLEEEPYGLEAAIAGGRLLIAGTQAHADMGVTSVRREVEGKLFAEFRARLLPLAAAGARTGIRFTLEGQGQVVCYRDGDGALRAAWQLGARGGRWSDPVELGRWPEDGAAHELAIGLEGERRELVLLLDGRELLRERREPLARRGRFACAIYVEAPLGTSVQLACEEARIYVVREED
ncbi:MAG: hypothetical protein KatS3mg102_0571 [Planctomycetota bacterium]|nr:MAG: hypothetical protein KatS3mg102_0571 [Planctomycetota bacterium]